MANPHAIGEAFHITSDETLSWNQIFETIAQALGVRPGFFCGGLSAVIVQRQKWKK